MDIDKLAKAIQILIREELKEQLPTLIKEVTKREVAKKVGKMKKSMLREIKNQMEKSTPKQRRKQQVVQEEDDPFAKAQQALDEDRQQNNNSAPRQKTSKFSSNPMINDILNETAQQKQQPQQDQGDSEFRTMNFDSSDVGTVAAKSPEIDRASMAAKMGYGDMAGGASMPQQTINNKPVNPNDPKTQSVQKALSRDYSELVKRFKK